MSAGGTVVIITNGRDPSEVIAAVVPVSPDNPARAVTALVWGTAPADGRDMTRADVIWLGDHPASIAERIVDALMPAGLSRALQASGPGRLVHSLLPGDLGRRTWRRARRVPAAVAALRDAQRVIAADPGAVRTAWFALHRLGAQSAVIAGQS